jgi:hypothetical protein
LQNISYNKAEQLFAISGAGSANIQLLGSDVSKVATKAVFTDGAAENGLEIKK